LHLILNGGLKTLPMALESLADAHGTVLDGVMLGRAPYDMPYMLADVDNVFFNVQDAAPSRTAVAAAFADYAIRAVNRGPRMHHVLRHIVGLYHGCTNARLWRQTVARIGQEGSDPHELAALAQRLDHQRAAA
jgi:tRNA-dihydrouridine synthase A